MRNILGFASCPQFSGSVLHWKLTTELVRHILLHLLPLLKGQGKKKNNQTKTKNKTRQTNKQTKVLYEV